MCVCIWTQLYTHVCAYVYKDNHIHTLLIWAGYVIESRTYIHAYIYTCIHAYITWLHNDVYAPLQYTYMHTCMHACTQRDKSSSMSNPCTFMHMHSCICMYIRLQTLSHNNTCAFRICIYVRSCLHSRIRMYSQDREVYMKKPMMAGTCTCETGWRGEACEVLFCPGNCSGHGKLILWCV